MCLSRLFIWSVALCVLPTGQLTCLGQPPEQVTVRERRLRADYNRWLFNNWTRIPSTRFITREMGRKPTSEYVRLFVTPEQFNLLEKAYDKRLNVHRKSSRVMDMYDLIERREHMMKAKRMALQQVDVFAPIPPDYNPPSSEDSLAALLSYVRVQDEAEEEWAASVDEILTPEQMDKFAPLFTKGSNSYLRNPLFEKYLGLNKAQLREIQRRVDLTIEEDEKAKKKGPISLESCPDLYRAYYRAFDVLTPEQFQKVAVLSYLKEESESWQEFRSRVERQGGVMDEEIGPIIDRIINLAKT